MQPLDRLLEEGAAAVALVEHVGEHRLVHDVQGGRAEGARRHHVRVNPDVDRAVVGHGVVLVASVQRAQVLLHLGPVEPPRGGTPQGTEQILLVVGGPARAFVVVVVALGVEVVRVADVGGALVVIVDPLSAPLASVLQVKMSYKSERLRCLFTR